MWRGAAEPFAEVTSDALGSSTARVKGTADGPTLAIVGHIDEIGLAVTHIDDRGFLYFRGIGGWLPGGAARAARRSDDEGRPHRRA